MQADSETLTASRDNDRSPAPITWSKATSRPPRVCIITVDPSGDAHGAALARALRRRDERIEIIGAGGPQMREAGVELVCDTMSWTAIGVTGYLAVCLRATIGSHKLRWRVNALRPDILVPIDSAYFNIPVVRTLRRWLGVPVLYYFPPRSWWLQWQVRPLKVADYVAAPFPWNVAGDDGTGRVRFVGHPACDLPGSLPSPAEVRRSLGLATDRPVLAFLPGSRRWEIGVHLPLLMKTVALVRRAIPEVQIVLSRAPTAAFEQIEAHLAPADRSHVRVVPNAPLVLRAADTALVCMGTATLEAAVLGCPMAAFYRVTRLAKLQALVNRPKTEFFAMPNIIAGERVVPELVQNAMTPSRLAAEALTLLCDEDARRTQKARLEEIRRCLGGPGASDRAAQAVFDALSGTWHTGQGGKASLPTVAQ
ncbi:MAG: lipid-A-disaccharide synthase [Candidatus Zipacnadales bacterium]